MNPITFVFALAVSQTLATPITNPELVSDKIITRSTEDIAATVITRTESISTEIDTFDYAAELGKRATISDTTEGWSTCKENMVLFARGTVEPGDSGVFVGPYFQDALKRLLKSVAFQGLSPSVYPALMTDYIYYGGNATASNAMAAMIDTWAEKCPAANFILGGYSQGALIVHNATQRLVDSHETAKRLKPRGAKTDSKFPLKAVVTFGDPNVNWHNITHPSYIKTNSICIRNSTAPDMLCSYPILEQWNLPKTIWEFASFVLRNLWDVYRVLTTKAQRNAIPPLIGNVTTTLFTHREKLESDGREGHLVRWALNLSHFKYGLTGKADEMAQWIVKHV